MAQDSDDFLFVFNIVVCVDCNPRDSGASLLTTAYSCTVMNHLM